MDSAVTGFIVNLIVIYLMKLVFNNRIQIAQQMFLASYRFVHRAQQRKRHYGVSTKKVHVNLSPRLT